MLDDLELQQVKDIADEARRGAVHDIQRRSRNGAAHGAK